MGLTFNTENQKDSDYSISSRIHRVQKLEVSPPIGGRLANFWKIWQEKGADPWTVSVLKKGYNLEFETKPPLTITPVMNLNSKNPQTNVEIQGMIDKGTLELVIDTSTPGFYSRIFVVPKTSGGWRPVIDLKALNRHLVKKPFKMETAQSIRKSLCQGMWTYSIDLKDAYFHVPIHPSSRKFLRIAFNNQIYQFKALPFGLSSAPWLFTKIFKQLAIIARQQNIPIHQYLDDWLGNKSDKRKCCQDRDMLVSLTQEMGCVINFEKSELEPSQEFDFVGTHYNLKDGIVSPTKEKMEKVKNKILPFFQNSDLPAIKWQSLLGLLNSLEWLVPWGKLHTRKTHQNLFALWSPQSRSQGARVPIWEETLRELSWWLDPANVMKGMDLHPPEPQVFLFTDASLQGWGAHTERRQFQGSWNHQEKDLHINVLEMRAVRYALLELNPPSSSVILLKSDNSTVVAYINRQGGTRSEQMLEESLHLFKVLQKNNWSLRARYLPGSRNVLADALSRKDQILPSEWSLHPQVVEEIFLKWEKPHIDMFATNLNNKLPTYVSPLPDPGAYAEDALSMNWNHLNVYAYPPTSILTKTVEKIITSICKVILIAPAWPTQPWFTHLLELSVDHPLSLPPRRNLLRQSGTGIFHSNPGHLRLHAWRLENKNSLEKGSVTVWPLESWDLKKCQLEKSTEPDGRSIVIGVKGKTKILSRPLFQS